MRMTRHELAATSGIRIETLDLWVEQEWLVPASGSEEARFSDVDAARIRLILELQNDFGANDAGIDVILHLMDQLHGMRQAFESLRAEMQRPPD